MYLVTVVADSALFRVIFVACILGSEVVKGGLDLKNEVLSMSVADDSRAADSGGGSGQVVSTCEYVACRGTHPLLSAKSARLAISRLRSMTFPRRRWR